MAYAAPVSESPGRCVIAAADEGSFIGGKYIDYIFNLMMLFTNL